VACRNAIIIPITSKLVFGNLCDLILIPFPLLFPDSFHSGRQYLIAQGRPDSFSPSGFPFSISQAWARAASSGRKYSKGTHDNSSL
jgi:hypothetical protein